MNRIAEEYNGTNWITKNSYGGSISLLNYKVKKRKNVNFKKNKKKVKATGQDKLQNDSNEKSKENDILNENCTSNNVIMNEQKTQIKKDSKISETNSNQIDEITFQLYFLKPKYYINESGKGVLKASILSFILF